MHPDISELVSDLTGYRSLSAKQPSEKKRQRNDLKASAGASRCPARLPRSTQGHPKICGAARHEHEPLWESKGRRAAQSGCAKRCHAAWTQIDPGSGIASVDERGRSRRAPRGWIVPRAALSRNFCVSPDSRFRNVLIALERSRAGEAALWAGVEIALKSDCRLTLLATYRTRPSLHLTSFAPLTIAQWPSPWELVDSANRLAQFALNRVGDVAPVTSIVRESTLVAAVLERSMIAEHDLVILGVNRANTIRRRWLAERIMRKDLANVLLVGPGSARRLLGSGRG